MAHPLVDVSALLEGRSSARARAAVAAAIGSALRTRGYFYAQRVHLLPAPYISSIYAFARRAHALPPHVKARYAQRGGTGAYSGPDIGQPEIEYEPGKASPACSWDYMRERFSLAAEATGGTAGDRYPGEAEGLSPTFVEVLDDLYERQNVLTRALLSGIGAALGLPPDTLLDLSGHGGGGGDMGTIRLISYPGEDDALVNGGEGKGGGDVGIGAHTDFELFTLMHQDASGLQLLPRSADQARPPAAPPRDRRDSHAEAATAGGARVGRRAGETR